MKTAVSLEIVFGPLCVMADVEEVILPSPPLGSSRHSVIQTCSRECIKELWASTDILFENRATYLLLLGPIAVVGQATQIFGEALCFILSGISLIPLAERLSFVTEQVAEHTNGTIGALVNATFGNAPELLIAIAALRSDFYRVVQLAMLGSMLTNMLLVFGVSCVVGGLRWQIQELRLTSGNINVLMLLLSTAGIVMPSVLSVSGHLSELETVTDAERVSSSNETSLSRFSAFVTLALYLCYLVFQLGTHRHEFDDQPKPVSHMKRNTFCETLFGHFTHYTWGRVDFILKNSAPKDHSSETDVLIDTLEDQTHSDHEERQSDGEEVGTRTPERRRRRINVSTESPVSSAYARRKKLKDSMEIDDESCSQLDGLSPCIRSHLSFKVSVIWLLMITLCIGAISDVLVDSLQGFAKRMDISEIFTSMIVVPFFSNVAEQVSAFLFAYRNEMDLVVGVTVGSAIQIATLVLPGSVLLGLFMGKSMTLCFQAYETVALLFSVVVVSAVLHGGTTNWLVGVLLVGMYLLFAGGVWSQHSALTSGDLLLNSTGLV